MTRFELTPTNGRKSFYKKAMVEIDTKTNTINLYSYNTLVCKLVNGEFIRVWRGWSATTANHINSFREHYGLPKINKAEWLAM